MGTDYTIIIVVDRTPDLVSSVDNKLLNCIRSMVFSLIKDQTYCLPDCNKLSMCFRFSCVMLYNPVSITVFDQLMSVYVDVYVDIFVFGVGPSRHNPCINPL